MLSSNRLATSSLIFISNLRQLLLAMLPYLDFFLFGSSVPQYNFPSSIYRNSASVSFFIGYYGLRRLFNRCCV